MSTQADDETARLEALGYTSEFKREMSMWANFSLGFTYLSPVVGIYTLFAIALAGRGARTLGLDITYRMLELGRLRAERASSGQGMVTYLCGDMTSLPFPPATFDLVTTGYGLRNVPDLDHRSCLFRQRRRLGTRKDSRQ